MQWDYAQKTVSGKFYNVNGKFCRRNLFYPAIHYVFTILGVCRSGVVKSFNFYEYDFSDQF